MFEAHSSKLLSPLGLIRGFISDRIHHISSCSLRYGTKFTCVCFGTLRSCCDSVRGIYYAPAADVCLLLCPYSNAPQMKVCRENKTGHTVVGWRRERWMKGCRAPTPDLTLTHTFFGAKKWRDWTSRNPPGWNNQTWILLWKPHMFCRVPKCFPVPVMWNVSLIMPSSSSSLPFFLCLCVCAFTNHPERSKEKAGGRKKRDRKPGTEITTEGGIWSETCLPHWSVCVCVSASYMWATERKPCQRYTPGSVSCSGSAFPHRTKSQVGHKRLFVLQPRLILQQVSDSPQDPTQRPSLGGEKVKYTIFGFAKLRHFFSEIGNSPEFSQTENCFNHSWDYRETRVCSDFYFQEIWLCRTSS